MRRALGLALCGVVLAACSAGTMDGPVVVSGGGTTGIYYSYGGSLASVLASQYEVTAEVRETGGSIENLHDLADGRSQLAFSAADAAGDAASGRAPFTEPLPVLAAARLYDEFVHLIVLADSPVESIADLRGATVSLGAPGSGTELIAGRLLDAAGVGRAAITNAGLGIDGSIEALQTGQIAAFFWSGGLPTPGVDTLAGSVDIRLIELGDLVDELRDDFGSGYRPGIVPQGTYRLSEDVVTLAVPNYLMVHAEAPDEFVYDVLAALFGQQSAIAAEVPAAALLDRHRAIYTDPAELHPGAIAYYRDTKP